MCYMFDVILPRCMQPVIKLSVAHWFMRDTISRYTGAVSHSRLRRRCRFAITPREWLSTGAYIGLILFRCCARTVICGLKCETRQSLIIFNARPKRDEIYLSWITRHSAPRVQNDHLGDQLSYRAAEIGQIIFLSKWAARRAEVTMDE